MKESVSGMQQASGLSITAARKRFDDMRSRAERVHQAIEEVKLIREAVDSMARTQEKAVLHSFGFTDIDSSSTDASDCDSLMSDDSDSEAFPEFDITESELIGLVRAHVKETLMADEDRTGEVVSESDSENPDDYLGANSNKEKLETLVKQNVAQLRRKAHRDCAKRIPGNNFLNHRRSKKVSGILKSCPNIGKEIEQFVKDRSIAADAWRRTGVLTFDGNKEVKEKVRIWKQKFGYGTVVQLCCSKLPKKICKAL